MFYCQSCGALQPPRTSSVAVVTEVRFVTHKAQQKPFFFKAYGKKEKRYDPGGRGPQIKREIRVCQACAKTLNTNTRS